MDEIFVSVLRKSPNCPVVQVSNRKYPGIILQGDTLFSLSELSRQISRNLRSGDEAKAKDLAEQLEDALDDFVELYEHVLGEEQIELPYVSRNPPVSADAR